YPANTKAKLRAMIENRKEWCISRQRAWGVPIAFFTKGDELLLDKDVLEHTASHFERYGCDSWWTATNEFFLPPRLHDSASEWDKCFDTLDVWYDSGLSWTQVNGTGQHRIWPNLYLEGQDQFRGWFQSSLLLCL